MYLKYLFLNELSQLNLLVLKSEVMDSACKAVQRLDVNSFVYNSPLSFAAHFHLTVWTPKVCNVDCRVLLGTIACLPNSWLGKINKNIV